MVDRLAGDDLTAILALIAGIVLALVGIGVLSRSRRRTGPLLGAPCGVRCSPSARWSPCFGGGAADRAGGRRQPQGALARGCRRPRSPVRAVTPSRPARFARVRTIRDRAVMVFPGRAGRSGALVCWCAMATGACSIAEATVPARATSTPGVGVANSTCGPRWVLVSVVATSTGVGSAAWGCPSAASCCCRRPLGTSGCAR